MKKVFFLLFVCKFYSLFSQQKEAVSTIDSTYIKDISDKLIIKINGDNNINTYKFYNKDYDVPYELRSNQGYKTFVSIDYKFLGFAIGIPQKYLPIENDFSKKGKTKSINFGFSFFMNRWLQNINYSYTKGFYLNDFYDDNNNYFVFPDYTKTKYSGTTSYVLNNKKFSYYAYKYQTAIQKKSAGSFIPSLNYYYLVSKDKEYNPDIIYKSHLYYANLALGYQYNWVPFKNLLISAGVSTGFGFNYSSTFDSTSKDKTTFISSNFAYNGNITMSYQIKNFFFGSQFYSNNVSSKEDKSTNLSNNINYGLVFIGYRFNAPKIIEKPFNWVEKKLF